MPIRNVWSLEPGECIAAEKIMKELKDCEIYFPLHDVGIDLLVVKGDKHAGIQVKESRYYFGRRWKSGHRGHSWHQVREKKFERDKERVNFYVFLTYLPIYGKHKLSYFENKFLVVPNEELERRMKTKDPGKNRVYSFCFHFDDSKVWDERVVYQGNYKELMDYSEYLDAWDLLKNKLE